MPTMSDVAKRAGVSVSTVSYALSGARPISDETRARIEEAMVALDYRPNVLARGLKSRRSRIVAFLLPVEVTATDAFTMKILISAAERARADGYHVLLWTENEAESLAVRDLARDGLVDGALIASVLLADERVDALQESGLTLVTIGRTEDCQSLAFVDTDDEQTARLALGRLHQLGHRSITFVGPPRSDYERGVGISVRTERSLERVAAELGMELRSVPCEFSRTAGADLVAAELGSHRPTAFLVMNGPALVGVSEGLARVGVDVPTRVSVVGLLSAATGLLGPPRFSSVSTPAVDLGVAAMEIMIALLEGDEVSSRQRLIDSRLVEGDTLGPAPE